MLNSLKSLIVVLLVLWPVAFLVRQPMTDALRLPGEWARMTSVWISLTVAAFLAVDFWIFTAVAAFMLMRVGRKIEERLALYFLVILAVPPLSRNVPGFGLINYVIGLDYLRLLSLLVLFPISMKIRREGAAVSKFGGLKADYAMVAFFVLETVLYLPYKNIAAIARGFLEFYLGVWLPYYVTSRVPGGGPAIGRSFMAYAVAAGGAGILAMFEWVKHWGVYLTVGSSLGFSSNSMPLFRDGLFRAQGSTGQPIVLGLALSVALGFWVYAQKFPMRRIFRYVGFVAIVGGLVATLSRGPWVGAAAMLLVFALLAPGAPRRLIVWLCSSLVVVGLLSLTPYGSTIWAYLPFTGNNVDAGSSEYRANLFLVSSSILSYYPFFGTPHFLDYMESLRTGTGLIDLVNTYLVVALPTGYVGLALWLLPFVVALGSAFRKCSARHDPEVRRLAATLVSVLIGCMVTIGTVSPIGVMPYLLYLLIGLCVAVGRMGSTEFSHPAKY